MNSKHKCAHNTFVFTVFIFCDRINFMKKCLTKRIREIRVKSNLTIQALSEKLEIPASSLGMYERGLRNPDINLVIKISKFFNVDISYFYEEHFEIKSIIEKITEIEKANEALRIAIERANGFCELCEKRGPFILENGQAYLEEYILKLYENSEEEALVMLCPNCHKKLLILNYDGDLMYLRKKIEREKLNE